MDFFLNMELIRIPIFNSPFKVSMLLLKSGHPKTIYLSLLLSLLAESTTFNMCLYVLTQVGPSSREPDAFWKAFKSHYVYY